MLPESFVISSSTGPPPGAAHPPPHRHRSAAHTHTSGSITGIPTAEHCHPVFRLPDLICEVYRCTVSRLCCYRFVYFFAANWCDSGPFFRIWTLLICFCEILYTLFSLMKICTGSILSINFIINYKIYVTVLWNRNGVQTEVEQNILYTVYSIHRLYRRYRYIAGSGKKNVWIRQKVR